MTVLNSVHSVISTKDNQDLTIYPSSVYENTLVITIKDRYSEKALDATVNIDELRDSLSYIMKHKSDIIAENLKKNKDMRDSVRTNIGETNE